jgi:tRNA 2-thiouridine synthesizing protein B
MSILHTVNKSPFNSTNLESCLNICCDKDSVLLIEDGVLGAHISSPLKEKIKQLSISGAKFYALENDLIARGISNKLLPGITPVTYQGFVDLTLQHKLIQSWY